MLKGYKTLIFNAVVLIAGLLGYSSVPTEVLQQYTEAIILVGGAVITGGNMLLRLVTTTPIFNGKKPDSTTVHSLAWLAVVGCALVMSGCATRVAETPQQKVAALYADYKAGGKSVLTFLQSDLATPAVKAWVKKLDLAAFEAIQAADKAVASGDDPKIDAAIAIARRALLELSDYIKDRVSWQPPPDSPPLAPAQRRLEV